MSRSKRLFVGVALASLMMGLTVSAQGPKAMGFKKKGFKAQEPLPNPLSVEDKGVGTADEDARLLDAAGLAADGPGLLEFFRGRARTETKPGQIDELLKRFVSGAAEERVQAATELVTLGPLAAPGLRRVANDLEGLEVRARALKVLALVEGPKSTALAAAVARTVARRKPAGAAEALLHYLPFADDEDVSQEVVGALRSVAVVDGQPDPALVRALTDPMPLRRATAGAVLGLVGPSERQAVEKLLADANPEVRLVAALGLARANHAPAIPVLIDLLPVVPVNKRNEVETFLQELAGAWAPVGGPMAEDEIGLRIRKGAWAAWWENMDGPILQAMVRKHALSPEEQAKVRQAIARLGDPSYAVREQATVELVAGGRMVLPLLREALTHADQEVVARATRCIGRVEQEPAKRLPPTALRLLALRRPAGAAETMLAYLPFAEEESLADLHAALAVVAFADGKPEPALLKALTAARPSVRAAAAEALAKNGGPEALPAVRKLLADADVDVRLRVGLALASRDAQAVSVLIGLMAEVPGERAWQIHDLLTRLAGDGSPPAPEDSAESRKTAGAAWAQWWRENAARADLTRLSMPGPQAALGYIVICDIGTGTVTEIGRDRKVRWTITGLATPVDARVLPNNRVLIAEHGSNRVTERDLKGNVIWQKQTNGNSSCVQRLPNGNTFMCAFGGQQMFEVDRNGKDVLTINKPGQHPLVGAYKDRSGHIVCLDQGGMCYRLDAAGKQLASFPTNRGGAWLDLAPNGHILLTTNGNQVEEYSPTGKLVLQLNVPGATTATGLANGNVLVSCNPGQVLEFNRKGQVVWEHRTQGPFRARVR